MNRRSLASFSQGLSSAANSVSQYILARREQLRKEQVAQQFNQTFGDKLRGAGVDPQMLISLSGHDPVRALSAGQALASKRQRFGDSKIGYYEQGYDFLGNPEGKPALVVPGSGVPADDDEMLWKINDPNTAPEVKARLRAVYEQKQKDRLAVSRAQGAERLGERELEDAREERRLNTLYNTLSSEIRSLEQDIKFRQENLAKVSPAGRNEAQKQLSQQRALLESKREERAKAESSLRQYDLKRQPAQAGKDTSWNKTQDGVEYRISVG